MPKPTATNRIAFKNYLRANKQKFTSGIQTCVLGDIQDTILTIAPGVSTSQITRVIIFDDNERVGLSTILNQRQLFYVPALPNDSIIIGVGTNGDPGIKSSRGYRLDFVGDGQGVLYGGQVYGLNTKIGLGTDISLKILGLGGALFLPEDPPSYNILSSSNNVTEGNPVSFTVTTSNLQTGTRLYYSIVGSSSTNDFVDKSLTGSFIVDSSGISTFTKIIVNDSEYNEFTEGFVVNVSTGSTIGPVVATSSTIFVSNLGQPSYTITPSSLIMNEGQSVSFTVNTVNIGYGTTLFYTLNGSISENDFIGNTLSGFFDIVGTGVTTGIGTFTVTSTFDLSNEGTENFIAEVRTGSISGPIVGTSSTVSLSNIQVDYTVTPSSNTVSEGGSVLFTVNTTNVSDGTVFYYTITGGVSWEDFADNNLSGSFIINNNTANFSKTIRLDTVFEPTESFQVQIRKNSISGEIVATSVPVNIINIVPEYSVTASSNSVNEGSSVIFTVNTTGVANGTILYYTTFGSVAAVDFTDASTSGSFIVIDNTATITRTIVSDRETDGLESFYLEIRRSSTSGTIVATSPLITVKDTSLAPGQNANGLTFGPVQVNRDNGNTALASDWYTICGLDNLPEGAKIALFIDNSGSMTTETVRASYNLLLSKLAAKNISIITVENGNEDWITPFLTDLS